MACAKPRVLIYILRRDVRLSDSPVFHAVSIDTPKEENSLASLQNPDARPREDSLVSQHDVQPFTHLLPVYVIPANQVEVSGFLDAEADRSPYPEARSKIAKVWRTGPHRAKFMAEGAWDLKKQLENLDCGSGLEVRVGMVGEVVEHMLDWYAEGKEIGNNRAAVTGIWITGDEGTEEKSDEAEVEAIARERGVGFKVWEDEKYFIDECVQPYGLLTTSRVLKLTNR